MKNIIFFLIVSCSVLLSCKSNSSSENTETSTETSIEATTETSTVNQSDTASVSYYCPMKCEKDKVYAEPGQCPVCKMDLEKVVVQD